MFSRLRLSDGPCACVPLRCVSAGTLRTWSTAAPLSWRRSPRPSGTTTKSARRCAPPSAAYAPLSARSLPFYHFSQLINLIRNPPSAPPPPQLRRLRRPPRDDRRRLLADHGRHGPGARRAPRNARVQGPVVRVTESLLRTPRAALCVCVCVVASHPRRATLSGVFPPLQG